MTERFILEGRFEMSIDSLRDGFVRIQFGDFQGVSRRVSAEPTPDPDPTTDPMFKIAIWGQSEHQHIYNQFDDVLTPNPLVDQDRVTFMWHDRVTEGAGGVQTVALNDTTVADGSLVTAAMVEMGNVFMRNMPDTDIVIVMHTMSGTTPEEIMDDTYVPAGGDKRRWQDDWALNAAATADGHPVDYAMHSWFAAPGTWGDLYGQNMFTFIKGRDHVTGADLAYSEASPLDVNGIQVSRTLKDLYPHEPQWITVTGAHTFIPTEDLQNSITSDGGGVNASLSNKEKSTKSWRTVIRNAALAGHFTGVEVFSLQAYQNGQDDGGVWYDQSHPWGGSDAGINRMARTMAHAIVRGVSTTTYGLPEIDAVSWDPDGRFVNVGSSAGPITTNRIAGAVQFARGLDMINVEQLHDAILAGRFHTGSRTTEYSAVSDWLSSSPAGVGVVAGVINLSSGSFDFRGMDFTGYALVIEDGVSADFEDCLIPTIDTSFIVDVYGSGSARFQYCTFRGSADGAGPGTLIRRRVHAGGHLSVIACRFEGYASDAVKPRAGDLVLFNYFDTPTPLPTVPSEWDSGATYSVGALVHAAGETAEFTAFVWENTVEGNTASPDFANTGAGDVGQTVNGWTLLNPHSDNLTLQGDGAVTVFGNVFNLDPARRQFGGTTIGANGANANIWSGGEDFSGSLLAANLLMRSPNEAGGNPMGQVAGATVAANRVESRGHDQSYWFDANGTGTPATFIGNIDATPITGGAVVPAPSGSVDQAVPAEWSIFDTVADQNDVMFARADLFGRDEVFPHWTDVVGFELDGAPVQRAEIQPDGTVDIYPNAGLHSSTTLLQFGAGGSSGWIKHDADAYAALWDNYPVVNVGLPDLAGVPLMQLPDPEVMASTIVGPASFRSSDAGPYFIDPAQTGVGRNQVTMLFEGSMDDDQADNVAFLVGAGGNTFQLAAIRSNQVVRLIHRPDGASSQNDDSAAGMFTLGAVFKLVACVDLVAGTAKVWLNDDPTPIIDATTVTTGGQFQTNRNVGFLDNGSGLYQFKGEVIRSAMWYAVTTDGSEPAGAPYKEIVGDAATVNADPWKQGADAT